MRSAAWQAKHQALPFLVVRRPSACCPQTVQSIIGAW